MSYKTLILTVSLFGVPIPLSFYRGVERITSIPLPPGQSIKFAQDPSSPEIALELNKLYVAKEANLNYKQVGENKQVPSASEEKGDVYFLILPGINIMFRVIDLANYSAEVFFGRGTDLKLNLLKGSNYTPLTDRVREPTRLELIKALFKYCEHSDESDAVLLTGLVNSLFTEEYMDRLKFVSINEISTTPGEYENHPATLINQYLDLAQRKKLIRLEKFGALVFKLKNHEILLQQYIDDNELSVLAVTPINYIVLNFACKLPPLSILEFNEKEKRIVHYELKDTEKLLLLYFQVMINEPGVDLEELLETICHYSGQRNYRSLFSYTLTTIKPDQPAYKNIDDFIAKYGIKKQPSLAAIQAGINTNEDKFFLAWAYIFANGLSESDNADIKKEYGNDKYKALSYAENLANDMYQWAPGYVPRGPVLARLPSGAGEKKDDERPLTLAEQMFGVGSQEAERHKAFLGELHQSGQTPGASDGQIPEARHASTRAQPGAAEAEDLLDPIADQPRSSQARVVSRIVEQTEHGSISESQVQPKTSQDLLDQPKSTSNPSQSSTNQARSPAEFRILDYPISILFVVVLLLVSVALAVSYQSRRASIN